jgi:hypothetical protein
LALSEPVSAFIGEIKALDLASDRQELDFVVGRHVADIFSHLYDKRSASAMIDAYAGDCVEGVYGGVVTEDLDSPQADAAFRYGKAITAFGLSAFEQLNALGAYNPDGVLPYSFDDFLGRDVVVEYLPAPESQLKHNN